MPDHGPGSGVVKSLAIVRDLAKLDPPVWIQVSYDEDVAICRFCETVLEGSMVEDFSVPATEWKTITGPQPHFDWCVWLRAKEVTEG